MTTTMSRLRPGAEYTRTENSVVRHVPPVSSWRFEQPCVVASAATRVRATRRQQSTRTGSCNGRAETSGGRAGRRKRGDEPRGGQFRQVGDE